MLGTKIFCLRRSARTQTGCASVSFLLWRGLMSIRGRRQPGWRPCPRRSRRRRCSRSGVGPELEVAGSGGHCRATGSASAAVGRGCDHGRNGDHKCRARNSKSPQSTEKLLVAVGGHGAGDVVHDAAPSGSDIERACRRIGIRRNIPIKEQHPSSGFGRSVPITLPFCAAKNRPAMPFCVHGLPQTSAAPHWRSFFMCPSCCSALSAFGT